LEGKKSNEALMASCCPAQMEFAIRVGDLASVSSATTTTSYLLVGTVDFACP
jgi:hypothetical protein